MAGLEGALRLRGVGIWLSGALAAAALALVVYASVVPSGSTLPAGSKVTPFSLAVFSSTSLPPEVQAQEAASARLLFDRDTTTQHVAFAESSVQTTFESPQDVRAIKVFGAAPYLLTVKADAGGSFQVVAGLENINLTEQPAAWNTFNATASVNTTKLLFVLTPATGGSATGLAELEVWTTAVATSTKSGAQLLEQLLGPTPPPHGRIYTLLNQSATPTEAVVQPGDNSTTLNTNTFRFTLDRDPTHFVRAYLTYELYGQQTFINARRRINEANVVSSQAGGGLVLPNTSWSTQVERIDPMVLVKGANTVKFTTLTTNDKLSGFTVRNVRVVGELDNGANAVEALTSNQPDPLGSNPVDALRDGNLDTGWRPYPSDQPIDAMSPAVELALRRPTHMDGVALYLSAPLAGQVQLSVQQGGVWSDLPAETGVSFDTGWNTIYLPPSIALESRAYEGVRLTFSGGAPGSVAEVRELQVIGSGVGKRGTPAMFFVTYPNDGQFHGRWAHMQGFVEPFNNGSGNGSFFVGSAQVILGGGTFSTGRSKDQAGFGTQADNDPWSLELKVTWPNGEVLTKTLVLDKQMDQATAATGTLAGSLASSVGPKTKKTIQHDESKLVVEAGTVNNDTTITITPLADENVPALDVGMVNVTKGPRRGYRFLPHGAKFLRNINVTLPYDRALIPPGHTEDDVRTYYFDDQAGRWVALPFVSVDKANKLLNSTTDHFTDMINAVVTVPDHPQAVSFNPTSMKDIKAADPGAQINLIEPPKANNMGDARLSYPIEVPPGRQGIQPQFAVSYSSGGGNGWMGMGWNLAQREISIETRWGVPRYHGSLETETYTLEGEMLTPVAHRDALQPRNAAGSKTFHTRVEGQFRKIIRHGNSPSTYWWEVIDKNGTRSIYGGDLASNGVHAGSVLRADNGGIYRWALREVRDLNGNRMTYDYTRVDDAGVDNSTVLGRQLYLTQCFYTGDATSPGRYSVTFVRDSAVAPDRRPDVQIDARGGFKQVTANLLKRIDVKFDSQPIRSYTFEYVEGAFKKTLLKSISQFGSDGRKFNEHTFAYYDDIRNPDGTYKGFGAPMVVSTGADNLVYNTVSGSFPHTVLGGTDGTSAGMDGYVGVGTGGTKNISVGVGFGNSRASSKGSNALIDVDGDGLPDKVFMPGLYRRNTSGPGALDQIGFLTSGSPQPVPGFARPSETESSSSNVSVQAFAVGVTANAGTATTSTRDKSYLADVNGDGLVDIVSGGSVLFNTARNTGAPAFSANSFDSGVPLGNVGGSVSKDIFPDVSGDKARLEAENPLMDNVRRWVAPYDGVVSVTGGVRLVDLANDPRLTPDERAARAAYRQADGVRVAIQHNGAERWSLAIPATDFTEHSPTGVGAIAVTKGDRLYFRVGSVLDGAYDQVAWSPTVEYTSGGSVQSGIDANNLVTAHYQAGEDTVYAGRPVEMMVPHRGTVRLDGILNKTAVTSDDVTIRVTVADRTFAEDGTLLSETIRIPVQRKLAWDFTGTVSLQEDFTVEKYSGVKVDLVVDSPIDHTKLNWGQAGSSATPRPGMPRLYYTQAFQDAELPLAPPTIDTNRDVPTHAEQIRPNGKAGLEPIPDENGIPIAIPARELETVDANGNPTLVMKLKYDADIYSRNNVSSPQLAWVAPRDGFILWTPWIKLKDGSTQTPPVTITVPDGTVTMTAKHRGNRLAKQVVEIRGNQVVQNTQGYYGVNVFRVRAGDEIFFDASTRNPMIEAALESTQVQISYASETAWEVPLTDSIDLLAQISGTGPAPNPAVTEERRALFVVRRNDTEILASRIIDFAATPTLDLSFARSVVQGDRLYFDVITVNPAVSVSASRASARYTASASFSPASAGQVSVRPALNFRPGAPDGSVTLTVLRNGAAVGQQTYTVLGGVASGPALLVDANPGQTLSFAYTTASFQMASFLADKGAVVVDDGTTQTTVGAASFTIDMPTPQFALQSPQDATHHFPLNDVLFGNPYRGWATAAYNGNGPRATAPISESLFTLSTNPEDYKSSATQHNAWLAFPAPETERWDSVDDRWWSSPLEVSASRKGIDSIYDPKADDFTDPRAPGFAGASRPPKMGKANQKVFGAGFYLSFTQSSGKTESQMDMIDMNGDRFPDLVGPGATQYTWADGTFFDTYGGSAARKGEDEQSTLGLSVGVPVSRLGAVGVILSGGDRDNAEKSSINVGASINKGTNQSTEELIDVNGDGLPDRVAPTSGGLSVALNTGYGFAPAETWRPGDLTKGTSRGKSFSLGYSTWNGTVGGGISVSENHNYTNTQLMDINGDGLSDVVFAAPGRLSVLLNTGSGFVPIDWPGALTPYKDFRSRTPGSPAVADGGSSTASGSIKYSYSFQILLVTVSFSIGINASQTASQPSISYTDLNGDGFVDSVLTADDASMTVVLNPIKRTNLLKTVNRPMGARIDLDYERVGNTFDMPQSRFVLSRVNVFDGVVGNGPDNQLTTYKYERGVYDRLERDFYGFGKVTEEDRDTAANDLLYRSMVREFLNDSYYRKGLLKRELLQDAQARPFTETENTYVVRDEGNGQPLADPQSTIATGFPQLTRTDKRFYEGMATPGKNTYTTHTYDAFGNMATFTDVGEPLAANDDVFAQIDYTNCQPTYVIKPNRIEVRGNGTVMRLREADIDCTTGDLKEVRQRLADMSAATTNLTYFPNGNLQSVTGPVNKNGQRYTLTYEYDAQVQTHVTRITDSFGLSSQATHNLLFAKVETTVDTNNNQITNFYDTVGRIERIFGPYEQGQSTATLSFEYKPDAAVPHAITRHVDKDADGNYKNSGTIDTILFTDGLKRVIQTKKDAAVLENGAAPQDRMIVSGQVTFDAFDRSVAQKYPTVEAKSSEVANGIFNTVADSEPPTTKTYDVLDRNTRTTFPDGTFTTFAFGFGVDRNSDLQFETVVTDANVNAGLRGAVKRTYRNVRELMTSVKEFNNNGTLVIWTSYAYDPLKQVVQVVDDKLNQTNVSYDNLGRRTAIDNPDTGRTETQYDLANNVTKKITANLRLQAKAIEYDYHFRRPISIAYPNFAGNNVTYTYGTPGSAFNRAGRITTITSQMGTEERQYGKLGETVYEKRTVVTSTGPTPRIYETRYHFETFGRLLRITYPDLEVVTNVYDSGGNLQSASGVKAVAASGQNHRYTYLRNLFYDKFEQRAFIEVGNGVKTAYAYNAQNRRLQSLSAARQGNNLFQNLAYTYDKVGNITRLQNQVDVPPPNVFGGPTNQSFVYDDLYRLTHAEGTFQYSPSKTHTYNLDLTYDTIHNIQRKNQLHQIIQPSTVAIMQKKTTYDFTYAYAQSGPASVRPHAPTHIGERTYTYDANGNQTGWTHDQNGTRRNIVWDDENRIQSLFDNGHEKTYKYDDQGERVIKRGPQGETVYVNQFFTDRPGSNGTKHVYAGKTRIASKLMRQDAPNSNPHGNTPFEKDLYFYHPDHLGSSNFITDLNGKLYEHLEYFPFGESWVEENSNVQRTPYLFSAKELDEETGLYYFGARYYDPRTTVWQSADPILGELLGGQLARLPQKLALYTYALQNPLAVTDPDGKDAVVLHGGFIGGRGGVEELSKTVRSFYQTPVREHRPSIDYEDWTIRNENPARGVTEAQNYKHASDPRILAGFSVGGDAALQAGKSEGGKNWNLRVVVGAKIGDDFMSRVEAAAASSDKLILVGMKGDTGLANDGAILKRTIGRNFGDRSYEGIVNAVVGKYGSMDKFYKQFPNVSIQAAEGAHTGGGQRPSTQDAVRRGMNDIDQRNRSE